MRTPNPDCVPEAVISKIARARTNKLSMIYNTCIEEGNFLDRWNEAYLVFLLKGLDKPLSLPSIFRPLCLLDYVGKALERLFLKMIK